MYAKCGRVERAEHAHPADRCARDRGDFRMHYHARAAADAQDVGCAQSQSHRKRANPEIEMACNGRHPHSPLTRIRAPKNRSASGLGDGYPAAVSSSAVERHPSPVAPSHAWVDRDRSFVAPAHACLSGTRSAVATSLSSFWVLDPGASTAMGNAYHTLPPIRASCHWNVASRS